MKEIPAEQDESLTLKVDDNTVLELLEDKGKESQKQVIVKQGAPGKPMGSSFASNDICKQKTGKITEHIEVHVFRYNYIHSSIVKARLDLI